MTLQNLRRIIVFATALILGMFLGTVEGGAQAPRLTPAQSKERVP